MAAVFFMTAFLVAAFLAAAFLAATFLGLTAVGGFPLAGRFFTAVFLTAAFLAATFFIGAFVAVPFFIAVFDFFFGGACFAFLDMSATFFADLAGFALAEPALSEVEGEAFALIFDSLGFAVDADRPDFFPLALGFSRALVAIVLSPPDFVWRKDKGTSDLMHYRAHGCVVSSLNPHLSL
ncbi:MAG: hypothetical protein OXF97_10325 [Nitrospira sp.]|nr:hypothetical protein [Nitrospira sp.]